MKRVKKFVKALINVQIDNATESYSVPKPKKRKIKFELTEDERMAIKKQIDDLWDAMESQQKQRVL